jgi:drug/metabolite transporter (DMT)-like permease
MLSFRKLTGSLSTGTVCGVVSAAVYTASNVCLRRLSAQGCDPAWVIFNREFATVLAIGAWFLWRRPRGREFLPPPSVLWRVLAAAALTHIVANLCSQWAMGTVGLAVTIPASFGTTIIGGAVLGGMVLRERISIRVVVAIALLCVAIGFLGASAGTVERSIPDGLGTSSSSLCAVGGILAACTAGVVFSILNVTTCRFVRHTTSPAAIGFLISLMGALCLGPLCLHRLGTEYWFDMPAERTALAAVAGILNFIAFVAQGYTFQRTTLVYANLLSASQVALAAVAGVCLFHESPSVWLLLGVCLTLLGVLEAGSSPSRQLPHSITPEMESCHTLPSIH